MGPRYAVDDFVDGFRGGGGSGEFEVRWSILINSTEQIDESGGVEQQPSGAKEAAEKLEELRSYFLGA